MSPHLIIEHIASALALPGLAFNEDGVCCILIPGELELQIESDERSGQILLLSPLGDLGPDPGGSLSRSLLAANFLFSGTRGETLSVEPDTRRIFLCAGRPTEDLSPAALLDWFAGFVDTAQQWRRRLADRSALPAAPHPGGASIVRV